MDEILPIGDSRLWKLWAANDWTVVSVFFTPMIELVHQELQMILGGLVIRDVDLDSVPHRRAVRQHARCIDDALPPHLAGLGVTDRKFHVEGCR